VVPSRLLFCHGSCRSVLTITYQPGEPGVSLYQSIKDATPWPLRRVSRRIKRELHWAANARQTPKTVFGRAYREGRWGGEGDEFYSGPGSLGQPAELYAERINAFIAEQGIKSVVDLGCGDFRVARRIVSDRIHYVGIDVVDDLISINRDRYGSDKVEFQCCDIIEDPLPDGQLCLIREVLQHLSNAEITRVLARLRKYRYVIYTDYQPLASRDFVPNRDIVHGHDTRLWKNSAVCLDQPPFNLGLELLLEVESSERLCGPGESIRTFLITSHSTHPWSDA
jgi:SAM-dependent methyltransferase